MAAHGPLLLDEQPDDAGMLRRTRLRLMAVSGFVTLVILLILGGLVYELVATSVRSNAIDLLKQRAGIATGEQGETFGRTILAGEGAGTLVLLVNPTTNQPVALPTVDTPPGLPDMASVNAVRNGGIDIREVKGSDGMPYRVLSEQVVVTANRVSFLPPGIYIAQVVQSRQSEVSLLGTLLQILLIGGFLALLAALAAGYLYAGRALVPIRDSIERRRLALRRQREFTANASHELRTPLTVIRGSVEDLRRNRRARVEDVGEALEDIDAEVNHLTALVEDLLLLARTDSGVLQLDRQPVDLADTAAEAVGLLTPLAHKEGVTVVLDPLPAPLHADPLRLRQLVTILVDNAVGHSPRGSQVMVWVRGDDRAATLRVEDQGPGIRPEDMPRIFERFWRADNAPAGGTGLGLAIAHWIVEQHGGTISVSNRDGGGARFEVRLPVSAAPAETPDEREAAASNSWLDDLDAESNARADRGVEADLDGLDRPAGSAENGRIATH